MTTEQQNPLSFGLSRPGAFHHFAAVKAKLALLILNLSSAALTPDETLRS